MKDNIANNITVYGEFDTSKSNIYIYIWVAFMNF